MISSVCERGLSLGRHTRYRSDLPITVSVDESRIYRVWQIKVIPCRVLLTFQQRIGIFIRKFTRLFVIHIYV